MTHNCSRKQQGPSHHSGPKTGLNFHGDYGATAKDSWTSLSLPQNLEYPYRPRQVILTATQIQSILDYDASLRSASDEELDKLKNGIDFPCPTGLQDFIDTLDNQTEEDRSLAFFRVNGHGIYIPEGMKGGRDPEAESSTTNKPTTSTSASTPLSAATIATAAAISDVEYDSDSPNDPIDFDEAPLPFMTEQASGSGVGDSTWEPDNLGDEDHNMDAEGDEEYPTNDELTNDDNTATSI
ncbi:hypothetical protein CPB84DRAFT_1753893 [Gymnopilus junonius]|uniref:Uncharacterized protein n=1 Tax=Gymnopilus junonius TaxID=109634 RepID=A0A9P5TG18_GYMJU|nr:hypothetical protein CPB84DRAFT_1753893 [Gymnopilus junonius]